MYCTKGFPLGWSALNLCLHSMLLLQSTLTCLIVMCDVAGLASAAEQEVLSPSKEQLLRLQQLHQQPQQQSQPQPQQQPQQPHYSQEAVTYAQVLFAPAQPVPLHACSQ